MDNYHEDMNSGFHAMYEFFIERPTQLKLVLAMERKAGVFHQNCILLWDEITELGETKGITDAKNTAEDALLDHLLRFRSSLRSMLKDKGDVQNLADIDLSDTEIRIKRDTELKTFAEKVYKLATADAEALVEHAIDEKTFADFRAAIDDYSKKMGKSIAGPQEKKEMRKAIFAHMGEMKAMLEDMDDVVESYRKLDKEFYDRYCALRPVKTLGVRHRKPEETKPETPQTK